MPNNPLPGRILLPACFTVGVGFGFGVRIALCLCLVGIVRLVRVVLWVSGLIRIVGHVKTSNGSFEPSHIIPLCGGLSEQLST